MSTTTGKLRSNAGNALLGAASLALTIGLLAGCSSPQQTSSASGSSSQATTTSQSHSAAASTATQTTSAPAANFPQANMAAYRSIVEDTLAKVRAGDQAGAKSRITDLETAWDTDQSALQPMDGKGWETLDQQIDRALKAVRASSPDSKAETQALTTLDASLQ